MTSYGLIFKLNIGLWALSIFGFISSGTALAFTVSWVIMDFLGQFKLDKAYIAHKLREKYDDDYNPEEEGESRAEEFKRKMREAEQHLPDATITMIDPDGNKSSIIMKADGRVITEGNPDPNIVAAAKDLAGAIKIFGTEAIAEQMEQFVRAYNEEQLRQEAEEIKKQLKDKRNDDN